MIRIRVGAGLALGLLLYGCGASSLARVAREGSLEQLSEKLDAATEAELEADDVREVASAMLEREILTAQGDSGVDRVREARACARKTPWAFKQRARRGDDNVAAAAAQALLEADIAQADVLFEGYARDDRPAWQAVAARAALGPKRGMARRAYFLAPDLRVRRGAVLAAHAEPSRSDYDGLLDVARHDPDSLVRSIAVQTLGAIGGAQVSAALWELWEFADEGLKQAIVSAWARPKTLRAGGHAALVRVLGQQRGLVQLVAARALLLHEPPGAPLRAEAEARLLAALTSGSADEQRLAAALLPHSETVRQALATLLGAGLQTPPASSPLSPAVEVALWGRLAAYPAHRTEGLAALHRLLETGGTTAATARRYLVELHDASVAAALAKALESDVPHERLDAALQAWHLGKVALAASALADPSAAVRVPAACGMLLAGEP